jgi:toxin FitB
VNGFLLDTNVLSEIRKGNRANPNVLAWVDGIPDDQLFISVLNLGEIRRGIEQARNLDSTKAAHLEKWLRGLELLFENRILPIDARTADEWGRIAWKRPLAPIDALLAATAIAHNLVFATRNTRDISDTGVQILNPFDP